MSPVPFVCANWKMNLTASDAEGFATALRARLEPHAAQLGRAFEVAIAPASPVLDRLGRALEGSGIALAAQHVHEAADGAFTGEVSVDMIVDLGARYALVGHSERRQLFGETDAVAAAKVAHLLERPVAPVLCVGETLDEREADRTLDVVGGQLGHVLDACADAPRLATDLVVAYEPVWAIGTGRTATPEIAQEVHAAIRAQLVERLGDAGNETRILYGGSVKPDNAKALLSRPDINGALVGGASLDPEAFSAIALAAID